MKLDELLHQLHRQQHQQQAAAATVALTTARTPSKASSFDIASASSLSLNEGGGGGRGLPTAATWSLAAAPLFSSPATMADAAATTIAANGVLTPVSGREATSTTSSSDIMVAAAATSDSNGGSSDATPSPSDEPSAALTLIDSASAIDSAHPRQRALGSGNVVLPLSPDVTDAGLMAVGGCRRCARTFTDRLALIAHFCDHFPAIFYSFETPTRPPPTPPLPLKVASRQGLAGVAAEGNANNEGDGGDNGNNYWLTTSEPPTALTLDQLTSAILHMSGGINAGKTGDGELMGGCGVVNGGAAILSRLYGDSAPPPPQQATPLSWTSPPPSSSSSSSSVLLAAAAAAAAATFGTEYNNTTFGNNAGSSEEHHHHQKLRLQLLLQQQQLHQSQRSNGVGGSDVAPPFPPATTTTKRKRIAAAVATTTKHSANKRVAATSIKAETESGDIVGREDCAVDLSTLAVSQQQHFSSSTQQRPSPSLPTPPQLLFAAASAAAAAARDNYGADGVGKCVASSSSQTPFMGNNTSNNTSTTAATINLNRRFTNFDTLIGGSGNDGVGGGGGGCELPYHMCPHCCLTFSEASAYEAHLVMHTTLLPPSSSTTGGIDDALLLATTTTPKMGSSARSISSTVTTTDTASAISSLFSPQPSSTGVGAAAAQETAAPLLKCKFCRMCCVNTTQLAEHEQLHIHRCAQCGKGFISVFELNIHMGTHTGYTYDCKDCGKCFPTRKTLAEHNKSHRIVLSTAVAAIADSVSQTRDDDTKMVKRDNKGDISGNSADTISASDAVAMVPNDNGGVDEHQQQRPQSNTISPSAVSSSPSSLFASLVATVAASHHHNSGGGADNAPAPPPYTASALESLFAAAAAAAATAQHQHPQHYANNANATAVEDAWSAAAMLLMGAGVSGGGADSPQSSPQALLSMNGVGVSTPASSVSPSPTEAASTRKRTHHYRRGVRAGDANGGGSSRPASVRRIGEKSRRQTTLVAVEVNTAATIGAAAAADALHATIAPTEATKVAAAYTTGNDECNGVTKRDGATGESSHNNENTDDGTKPAANLQRHCCPIKPEQQSTTATVTKEE